MPMNKSNPQTACRNFGSRHDPLLHVVAHELNDLCPPIHSLVRHHYYGVTDDAELPSVKKGLANPMTSEPDLLPDHSPLLPFTR